MKKTFVFLLTGLMFILAACDSNAEPAPDQGAVGEATESVEAQPVPARPGIRMSVADTSYVGLAGAYCWPQAANDIRCEPDPLDLTPAETIAAESGDMLTFSVISESGAPAAFYATLLDDTDKDGAQVVVDFGPVSEAEYEVDLDSGPHRFSVVAEFPGASGDTSFVTTIFAVEIPESVAEVPTATTEPTQQPPTAAPTEVVEITEEATEEPTAEAAEKPTEQPTAEIQPTPVPPPTTVPPTVPPPVSGTEEMRPPAVVIINGGNRYLPSGIEYCMADTDSCVDIPATAGSERLLIMSGVTLRIDAENNGPESMTVSLRSTDLSAEFQRDTIPGNAVSLHTVSGNPGNYVLHIEAQWPDGVASYYFRLQITG
jgi:cell division septation protein DedD